MMRFGFLRTMSGEPVAVTSSVRLRPWIVRALLWQARARWRIARCLLEVRRRAP